MTVQHITRTFALNLLNDIVKDEGANTEAACRYTNVAGDAPVCIVGHALFRLGVPVSELAKYEGQAADSAMQGLANDGYFEFDEDAGDLLTEAQAKQDTGASWDEAVVWASGFDPDEDPNQEF
jgi:hypothetical protein